MKPSHILLCPVIATILLAGCGQANGPATPPPAPAATSARPVPPPPPKANGQPAASPAPLDLKGTRVLACASYPPGLTGMPVLKRLTAAGAAVRFFSRADLTWEEARKFQVIIVVFDAGDKTAADLKRSDEVLEKFAAAGGGIFFFYSNFEPKDMVNQCLAPFGAVALRDYVQDPQHAFVSPAGFYNLSYAYTANIAPDHPVTAGVKGIWYDVDTQSECEFTTTAIEVSKDWTTLVAGEASATTFFLKGQVNEGEGFSKEQQQPGKYQSAPPLIAAREYGAGAVVLTGLNALEMFYGQGLPHYGEVAMAKGDGLRRSDFGQLYANALNWLAQHGRRAATLGQGELPPVVTGSGEPVRKFDWSQDLLPGQQCARPSKGVIGLHSTLSDGHDTPAALIAKAKASGLQWVAFTEKLEVLAAGPWDKRSFKPTALASTSERSETLSPAKWEQLRQICRAASTADFAALPGLDYADATGARWVVFGDFEWPDVKSFSPDRKQIISPIWWFTVGNVPNGPYNVGHNRLHPWDYLMYNLWPIRTTVAGRQTDAGLPSFMHNQGVQDDPFPMAVDMVYNASELEAAAGRMCNYVTLDQPRDLAKFYRDHYYFGSWLGFVSDGPLVTDWQCANGCRSTEGQWYVPSTEQYRLKLSVESATPITDIRIYDGPTLFRRFCPKQPKATVTLDIPHDQQRNLFAVITDAQGKQAVTGGQFIRDLLNFRFMCADRGNSICDAVQVDESGAYIAGLSAPCQRKLELFGVYGAYGLRQFLVAPPEVDGGMRPISLGIIPSVFYQVALDPQRPKLWPIMETRMEVPVCSRDGILQEHTSTGIFDQAKGNGWDARQAPEELRDLQIKVRYLYVTPRPGDMGAALLEGRIRFANAIKLKGPITILAASTPAKPGNGDHYALVTPAQSVVGLCQTEPYSTEAPMTSGSYAMIFPAQLGSSGAMALEDGYTAQVGTSYPNVNVAVQLDSPRDLKAGDELKYRLLLIHGRPNEPANNADWEMFAGKMGLRGPPAYRVADIRAGQVKGTKFLLELEPEDSGFAGTIPQCDLPIRLPIRVAHMNPNWTFAWFDLDRKEWFPSAVDPAINQGYFTLDTRRGNHRFFAGHPVVADNKELRILVLSDGQSKIHASVNNVGDAAVEAIVRLNPALGKAEPARIHLEPGEVKNLEFGCGL